LSVALNAPCPCGSGKKYKRCCFTVQAAADSSKKARLPKLLVLAGLVAGVVTYLITDDLETGGLVVLGSAMAALALWGFSDPPPPKTGSGDPAGMNFGR